MASKFRLVARRSSATLNGEWHAENVLSRRRDIAQRRGSKLTPSNSGVSRSSGQRLSEIRLEINVAVGLKYGVGNLDDSANDNRCQRNEAEW